MKFKCKFRNFIRKLHPYLMGFAAAFVIAFLIIPGFKMHGISVHVASTILIVVIFAIHVVMIKTRRWEFEQKEKWKMWEEDNKRFFEMFMQHMKEEEEEKKP